MPHRVLIAEDDPIQRHSVRRMLEAELEVEVLDAPDGETALTLLCEEIYPPISLALLDLAMPKLTGMELLHQLAQRHHKTSIIVLTGSDRVEDAVEAMRLGAIDFISKPVVSERLITSVRNALAMQQLEQEVSRLKQDKAPVYRFENLLDVSPGLATCIALGRKAARSEIPVLLNGESGVGKEVFARAIHLESDRRDRPMIAVNCGALPDNLVESTLFGHEKGAFTGALNRSIGKCREADGGVLFFDEIGDLKLETQVKLLRMLQEGEIEPVGSSKTVKVDVRVISATNHSLEQRVSEGKFREDLFYRLQGFPIVIPALRERSGDIAPLARHLLNRIAAVERRPNLFLAEPSLCWLAAQHWPGNARELQHLLHRTVLMSEHDRLDLNMFVEGYATKSLTMAPPSPVCGTHRIELFTATGQPKTMDAIEQETIERMLRHFDAHIGKTAAALGIGQSTLYKRIKPMTH